jgi:superfamily II DNA or RNA helicase
MVSALIPLRPYQRDALDAWKKAREEENRNRWAIVLPTGGGKTVCFAHAAKEWLDAHPADRVLVLVHTKELVEQAAKKIKDNAPHLLVGIVKGARNEVTADVVVASVQSLRSPTRRNQLRNVSLIVVDECHHATAATYKAILDHFDGARTQIIGFTATLMRGDGGDLSRVWGDRPAFVRSIAWMIRKRYLIPPRGIAVEVPDLDLANVKATKADYREGELGEALATSLAPELVAKAIGEHAADRKTVAFFPTVNSAYVFAEAMDAAGIDARVIHGGLPDDEREAVLAWHRRGTVLVNCMILTEGYDDPEVDCIVIGRPTKSKGLYVQIVGRGIRVDPSRPYDEQDCLLLDVVGANRSHDLRSIIDLSEKPLPKDRDLDGKTLIDLEDEFDAGEGIAEEDEPAFYQGPVEAREFDPLGAASRSAAWVRTKGGTYFVPAGKHAYVFIFEYPRRGRWSVAWCTADPRTSMYECPGQGRPLSSCANTMQCKDCKPKKVAMTEHADLDLELAMGWAEDLAVDLGADSGLNTANKRARWRSAQPSEKMLNRARALGIPLHPEVVDERSGFVLRWRENAGKVSDLMNKVEASHRIDPLVARVKEKMK